MFLDVLQGLENGEPGAATAHEAAVSFGTWPLMPRKEASFQQREIALRCQNSMRFLPIGPASYSEIPASFL
jgi:hypothetical protein